MKALAIIGFSIVFAAFGFALWWANLEFGGDGGNLIKRNLALVGMLLALLSPLWAWLTVRAIAKSDERTRQAQSD
ncbi:MAG: hypothetical protein AAF739_11250 [Pseudomonadota bacterium]